LGGSIFGFLFSLLCFLTNFTNSPETKPEKIKNSDNWNNNFSTRPTTPRVRLNSEDVDVPEHEPDWSCPAIQIETVDITKV
jgi:hypothetical protein